MRFDSRFRNGVWVVFDNQRFEPVRACGTRKECEDRAGELEQRVAARKR